MGSGRGVDSTVSSFSLGLMAWELLRPVFKAWMCSFCYRTWGKWGLEKRQRPNTSCFSFAKHGKSESKVLVPVLTEMGSRRYRLGLSWAESGQ